MKVIVILLALFVGLQLVIRLWPLPAAFGWPAYMRICRNMGWQKNACAPARENIPHRVEDHFDFNCAKIVVWGCVRFIKTPPTLGTGGVNFFQFVQNWRG